MNNYRKCDGANAGRGHASAEDISRLAKDAALRDGYAEDKQAMLDVSLMIWNVKVLPIDESTSAMFHTMCRYKYNTLYLNPTQSDDVMERNAVRFAELGLEWPAPRQLCSLQRLLQSIVDEQDARQSYELMVDAAFLAHAMGLTYKSSKASMLSMIYNYALFTFESAQQAFEESDTLNRLGVWLNSNSIMLGDAHSRTFTREDTFPWYKSGDAMALINRIKLFMPKAEQDPNWYSCIATDIMHELTQWSPQSVADQAYRRTQIRAMNSGRRKHSRHK